jgi:hypothetical protein
MGAVGKQKKKKTFSVDSYMTQGVYFEVNPYRPYAMELTAYLIIGTWSML